ncbi:hypothetical protein [Candidatus Lokiarchaeum ossiferum]|uniref:hypothetical protein n=1 Tax=Candidatus Lokiarchaeum ossiferum TaxID=2951803 RepID=UPI00352D3693
MAKFSSPYNVWRSSKIIRRLISIIECGKIAKNKKIANDERDLQNFLQYLLDNGYIKPFTTHNKYSTDVRFNRWIYFQQNSPEEIPYFHPLQLVQLLDIFYSTFLKNPQWIGDDTYQEYVFNNGRKKILKETTMQIQKEAKNLDFPFGIYVNPQETYEEWQSKQFIPWSPAKKELQIWKNQFWVSNQILELWVKLENLFKKDVFITRDQFQSQNYSGSAVPQSEVQEYNTWRQTLNIKNQFSKEEIIILENLLFLIRKKAQNYGMGLENEFEILPYLSSHKFTHSLWIASQFLEIQRYLIRCLYYISEQDYTNQRPFPGKPDFICLDTNEYEKNITRISIHHGLRLHTFKLMVEGTTEQVLIQKYIDNFWISSWARVINMRGIDNNSPYEQVFQQVNDPLYWYLLDYDKGQHEKKYELISQKTWLTPDFITEFFSPKDIVDALKTLLEIMGKERSLTINLEKSLDSLLFQLDGIKPESGIGYESILTEYVFDSEDLRKFIFPRCTKWPPKYHLLAKNGKKTLKNKLNSQISTYLQPYFIRSENQRPVRNTKFDEKMKPFLEFCDKYIRSNWIQQASNQNKKPTN